MKKISLGFSPCPNDTFMFDAMVHHKIDTEDLEFELFMHDVELLNQKAFSQSLDVTKISFHAFAFAVENYVLLNSGSALGFGVGPLLIGKNKILAVLFVIIFNTSYCKAQLYKEELYEIIQKRYYNEYVKDYYLINFGKDSIKIKLSYVFKEFFIGYFNNYRIFQISLSGYGIYQ